MRVRKMLEPGGQKMSTLLPIGGERVGVRNMTNAFDVRFPISGAIVTLRPSNECIPNAAGR